MCILLIPSGLSVSDHETAVRECRVVALHLFLADEMNRCIIVGEVVRHRYDLFFDACKISTLFSNNIALSCVFLSRCELRGLAVSDYVRSSRETDTFFKRTTAQGFYKLMNRMGANVVYNHADYRLLSAKVIKELANFKEVNIFLRGMIPLVGFKSTCVYYERHERLAGESHYPLKKMLALAIDGITSLSTKPIRIITSFGFVTAILSLIGIIWSVIAFALGKTVAGWASLVTIIFFFSGIQLLSLGVIGEYIGKIYLETKARPRFIIEKRAGDFGRTENND